MGKGILVGLTGQTGAGKTLVSSFLIQNGYRVINADVVARRVVEKGSKCILDLALEFGIDIVLPDGTLNRRKVGDMVFSDRMKRKKLNEITFPYIQEEIFLEVERLMADGVDIIFLDAPTLIESGTHNRCDIVVSILAPAGVRLGRIMERDNLTKEQALARISAQHGDEFYISKSDYVIQNEGDLAKLRSQLEVILNEIRFGEETV